MITAIQIDADDARAFFGAAPRQTDTAGRVADQDDFVAILSASSKYRSEGVMPGGG
jgi:hypothetical protein